MEFNQETLNDLVAGLPPLPLEPPRRLTQDVPDRVLTEWQGIWPQANFARLEVRRHDWRRRSTMVATMIVDGVEVKVRSSGTETIEVLKNLEAQVKRVLKKHGLLSKEVA